MPIKIQKNITQQGKKKMLIVFDDTKIDIGANKKNKSYSH